MTERGRATRARLIEATRSVVREVGYPHASTRAIAEAAGVAEGTIYRHFPDKAALFFAAALESSAGTLDWVSGLPGRAGQASVEANLTDALVRLAELQDEVIPLELAIAMDPQLARERRRAAASAGGRLVGPPDAIAEYLEAEQHLGRIRAEVDPRSATRVILATLFGLGVAHWQSNTQLARADIAGAVALLLRGLVLPEV